MTSTVSRDWKVFSPLCCRHALHFKLRAEQRKVCEPGAALARSLECMSAAAAVGSADHSGEKWCPAREQRAGWCRYGETGEGQQCRKQRQVGEHTGVGAYGSPPSSSSSLPAASSSSKARLNSRMRQRRWVAFGQAASISGDMTVARLASPPQSSILQPCPDAPRLHAAVTLNIYIYLLHSDLRCYLFFSAQIKHICFSTTGWAIFCLVS